MFKQKYQEYKLFFVMSDREGKKPISDVIKRLPNVLIFSYNELNETELYYLNQIINRNTPMPEEPAPRSSVAADAREGDLRPQGPRGLQALSHF